MNSVVAGQAVTALLAIAGLAGMVSTAEQASVQHIGISLSSVMAAFSGALVPAMFMPTEQLRIAVRNWVGSVIMSLICTAAVMLYFKLDPRFGIFIAGVIAVFARDIVSTVSGQLPPILGSLRERFIGPKPKQTEES